MQDNDLPITDWTYDGRLEYVNKNRLVIELVIEQALENFDEQTISLTFQTQGKAVIKIIDLFNGVHFNVESLPNGIPKDITLFSQLAFWVKYKSAGMIYTGNRTNKQTSPEQIPEPIVIKKNHIDLQLEKLAINLNKLNQKVAADLIGYWLSANKKLLNELSFIEESPCELEIDNDVSDTQKTRYKADASFRFLYLFFNIREHLSTVELYENKYLVKGSNRPQYVARYKESHHTKTQIRQTIKSIIDKFNEIYVETEDKDFIIRALFKSISKSAVLDVYEINKNDPSHSDYVQKLKQLKVKPSLLMEQVS
ncbi:hypothetical protein [Colwellia sp. Arc7-D]|uniref:hypothetical protein n=1 Tax=Colwellia sp. Arc7-D TaxID=2161872 RepID=UPI000D36D7AC|nr:hypothetical protein [Colwellia sp. Arc7-D]AWB57857.1 hypothetical protein DBO93_09920 [Colwellia sp. Arc7-D]